MAKKILLADDSLTIQKVVELTFSDSEYDLVCVSNGQRALDRIEAGELPDLILADVVMPEKNGYEVCEAVKSNPVTARIPVVLLSGTFEPFDRERAERLGCDAIISKPFDSQQLLRQVEGLVSRPSAEVPSAATVAIPIMTNPAPPPPSAEPGPAPLETGFRPEEFTGSIPAHAPVAGGADLFEEEYGQGDVESAIAAFEKAHPEFAYSEESAALSVEEPGEARPAEERGETSASPPGWLHEEPEASGRPEIPPAPAPAPFWVPRETEPDLEAIPFGADDSGARRAEPPPAADSELAAAAPSPMRADEAPTQQIPLSADFAAFERAEGVPGDRETDEMAPPVDTEERTAEIPIIQAEAASEAPPAADSAPAPSEASIPVSEEIEVLAQTTSIGQLKEMLSSVSRPEGGLSDDDIDRLASRVVERLSERIVREIAWEVIPDVAELVIRQRIKELEAGVE